MVAYTFQRDAIVLFKFQWERFKTSKPLEGINQPEDIAGLQYAIETIGDYKLKSAADYKVPPHLRENKLKKYKELLLTREKVNLHVVS